MNEFISNGPAMDEVVDKAAAAQRGFRAYNRLGWAFVIFLGSLLVIGNVVVVAVSAVNPDLLGNAFFGMPMNYIVMYLIGLPLMLLPLRGLPNAPAAVDPARKKMGPLALIALYPVLFAIVGLVSTVTTLIEQRLGTAATVTTQDIMASGQPQWITFVLGVIVAPVMEEIVFRLLVYKKASGYGRTAFVLWSAAIFGLFHLNFGQSIYAAALGAVFALVMLRTGSVLHTVILHVMINFTGGIGLGSIILSSGNETAVTVYSTYTMALLVLGIVIGIVMLVMAIRNARARGAEQRELPAIKKRTAFLNPGSLVYCVICLALIASAFFS